MTAHLLIALVCIGGLALASGCKHVEDTVEGPVQGVSQIDHDSDGEYDPCDQVLDIGLQIMEQVCEEYPNCTLCDAPPPPDELSITDEQCQELLDGSWSEDLEEETFDECEFEASF
jgi:hypothetical protein